MRKFIEIITEATLMEGQRYEDMFNPVVKLGQMIEHDEPPMNYHDVPSKFQTTIENEIQWAKHHLKRKDRITWWLKLVRMDMIRPYASLADSYTPKDKPDGMPHEIFANQLWTKWDGEYQRNATALKEPAMETGQVGSTRLSGIAEDLVHYFSLPIQAIKDYEFSGQGIPQVFTDFGRLERAWQEERKGTLTPQEGDEIILSKTLEGNDWAWFHLDRAYCSDEADAMGHCGNQPRAYSKDNILSLRKKVGEKDDTRWKPYATFILMEDGSLSEMKGRFNEKPGKHGHREEIMAMIHALLELPLVKRLRGGGHAAHNNFAIHDLGEDSKEALLAKRPELGNAYHYLKTKGYDEKFEDILSQDIVNLFGDNRMIHDVNDDHVVLEQWEDLTRMINHYAIYVEYEPLDPITEMAAHDEFQSIGLDDPLNGRSPELADIIETEDRYAEAKRSIGNAGLSVVEFFEKHGESMEKMRENLTRKISDKLVPYMINAYNQLPFDVAGVHLVLLDDMKVEARINTEILTVALESYVRSKEDSFEDEWGDIDLEATSLSKVAEDGWFSFDYGDLQYALSDEAIGSPKELLQKLQNATARIVTKKIHKLLAE